MVSDFCITPKVRTDRPQGHTLTKEIPLRRVCEVIRDAAFVTSDLPVIVSLEVHCNHEGQQMIADIIDELWKPYLLPSSTADEIDKTPLPPLSQLKKKILIKVKYTPPEKAKARKLKEDKDDKNDSSSDEDEAEDSSKKKGIHQRLAQLGIYTRAFHFKSFEQPEAKLPTVCDTC